MSAEIVVVLQDQDPGPGAGLPEVVGGRQAADAAAHHDQVVLLASIGDGRRGLPERAVAEQVERLERPWVGAAEAGQRRRIGRGLTGRQPGKGEGAPDPDLHTVDKVPATDGAVYAKGPVAFGHNPPKATSLVSRYSDNPSAPLSCPSPLCFQPPNGASVAWGVHSFTPIIPNSSFSAA